MRHAEKTITYYSMRDGRSIKRLVLNGVSYRLKTAAVAAEKGALIARSIICRIPIENAPTGFVARENDMIVEGICEADNVSDSELRHKYGAATVKAATDNREGLAPHWKLEAV